MKTPFQLNLTWDSVENKSMINKIVEEIDLETSQKKNLYDRLIKYAKLPDGGSKKLKQVRLADEDGLCVTLNLYTCNFGAGYEYSGQCYCPSLLVYNPEIMQCDFRDSVPSQYLSWICWAAYTKANSPFIDHPGQHVYQNGQKNCSQVGWKHNN